MNNITIGGYWEDIACNFWRVKLESQDVGLSLNLSKCDVICQDHTTQGSLFVDISGLLVVRPE